MIETNDKGIFNGRTKSGFTLIELLVTVSVLSLLFALVLSAVQSARAAAKASECLNNIRQIGLAMSNYVGREGRYPTAMMKMANGKPFCFSGLSHILADLGQISVFNALNFQVVQPPIGIGKENITASDVMVSQFLCPADRGVTTEFQSPVNFRLNMGTQIESFRSSLEPNSGGVFELEQWIAPSQITDGLSTTTLLAERLLGDGNTTTWDRVRDPWLANLSAASAISERVAICEKGPLGMVPHYSFSGSSWLKFSFDDTLYNHIETPNALSPDCSNWDANYGIRGGSDSGSYCARSLHNSGIHCGLADGSSRWVSNHIAFQIWRALGTRAGNEVINESY